MQMLFPRQPRNRGLSNRTNASTCGIGAGSVRTRCIAHTAVTANVLRSVFATSKTLSWAVFWQPKWPKPCPGQCFGSLSGQNHVLGSVGRPKLAAAANSLASHLVGQASSSGSPSSVHPAAPRGRSPERAAGLRGRGDKDDSDDDKASDALSQESLPSFGQSDASGAPGDKYYDPR